MRLNDRGRIRDGGSGNDACIAEARWSSISGCRFLGTCQILAGEVGPATGSGLVYQGTGLGFHGRSKLLKASMQPKTVFDKRGMKLNCESETTSSRLNPAHSLHVHRQISADRYVVPSSLFASMVLKLASRRRRWKKGSSAGQSTGKGGTRTNFKHGIALSLNSNCFDDNCSNWANHTLRIHQPVPQANSYPCRHWPGIPRCWHVPAV